MADGTITPPAGFKLDTPAQNPTITPPPGFKLDTPEGAGDTSVPTHSSSFMENVVASILSNASESAKGASSLLEKGADYLGSKMGMTADEVANKQVIPGASTDPYVKGFSVPRPSPETQAGGMGMGDPSSVGAMVGGGAEQLGEWAVGDAEIKALADLDLLKGPAKALKLTQLAQKYPTISKMIQLTKDYPLLSKLITEVPKAAAIGGEQGALHAEGSGQSAVKGAEGGAAGGAIGAGVGETASSMLGEIMKLAGVGTDAGKKAMQAFKPGVKNINFLDDFQRSAPVLDSFADWKNARTATEGADAATLARQNWWQQEVKPVIDQHSNQTLNGYNIAQSMRNAVPAAMRRNSPEEARIVDNLAHQYETGQNLLISVGDAEEDIEHYNAKVANTGFWSKSPSERNATLEVNGTTLAWDAAADAIRDELYWKLDQLSPGTSMAEKKLMYGSLRNMENLLRGRSMVEGRQAQFSLKQTLGILAGIKTGGLAGLVAATLPMVDREYNSAMNTAQRAVKQAATGKEGVGAELAKGVAKKAPKLAAPAGAAIGRVHFQSSDGVVHSIPNDPNAIKQALQIDPNIQFINMNPDASPESSTPA